MNSALFASSRKSAVISECGRYRYALLRRWGDAPTFATFVLLNPSTADAEQDDPTIRRCIGFAKAWGLAALRVVNVYALRSTDPEALRRADDPVGPLNDRYLTRHAEAARDEGMPLVAAWGAHADPNRVRQVLALPGMTALTALGTTKDGHPRHPLYLPAAAARHPWPVGGSHD